MEEHNLRRNFPASDPDRSFPCRGGELTRTDSVSSTVPPSSSAVSISKESFSLHPDAGIPDELTGWTDERHDSYLNFLEERFVKQLNHSMQKYQGQSENLGWGPYSTSHVSKNVCDPFNQFPTPQDGSPQKINTDRDELLLNNRACFDVPIESPCKHRFTSAGIHYSMTSNSKEHGISSSQCPRLQEASGQNFLEEDLNAKSNGVHPAKRSRKAVVEFSCTDQIVPSGTCHTANVSMPNTASTESKESQKDDLLSEQPEGSVYMKADMHYFLRGI